MESIEIGCTGFAQVGDPDYFPKMRIEMAVLSQYLLAKYPIPEALKDLVWLKTKSFPHDFGTYHELCIIFDDVKLELQNESAEPCEPFWTWIESVQAEDLETEELMDTMQKKYMESIAKAEMRLASAN